MYFYAHERVALFIDGENLHASLKSLDFDLDYRRLVAFFRVKARVIRALYYASVNEDETHWPSRQFIDWLGFNGFTVVTKLASPAKRYRAAGTIVVELVVDALSMAKDIDHIVLLSGDGDFRRLVAVLQERGKRVTVVSTLRSRPPMISDALRRQADQFVELAELKCALSREARSPPSRHPFLR
jgi:uncharacterized LabA/DUF88 family protein